MWPTIASLFVSGHVLPSAVAEKPMVTADDQCGAVVELDTVRSLDGRPVRQDLSGHEAPIFAHSDSSIDLVSDCDVAQRLCAAVRH